MTHDGVETVQAYGHGACHCTARRLIRRLHGTRRTYSAAIRWVVSVDSVIYVYNVLCPHHEETKNLACCDGADVILILTYTGYS